MWQLMLRLALKISIPTMFSVECSMPNMFSFLDLVVFQYLYGGFDA
jgi:hypothetical protein